MKRLVAFTVSILAPVLALAQDAGMLDAGVLDTPPATPPPADPLAGIDFTQVFQAIYTGITSGNWWSVAALVLLTLVLVLRRFGQWIHEKLPDNTWADKVFWFLLETKPGGWIINILTSLAAGLGSAALSGHVLTWAIVKPVLAVSFTAAALWGLGKDLYEWFMARKAAASAPAPVVPQSK